MNDVLDTDEQRLARAWSLKDECYAAWTSDPRRAERAASALRTLCDGTRDSPAHDEIEALAAWTEGIACVTRGSMSEAVASFDRADAIFRRLDEPHHAAQTQVPKIMALSMLGQHAEAARCAEATQRDFVAQRDMHAAAKVSLNLGSLHLRQDAYVHAARHYREAAVLFARVRDIEHSVMADIGLADALTSLGEFDEATRMYARADMRARTHGFPVLAALVDESVALVALVRGHYREALAGLERARRSYDELSMPQHLAIAEKQLADAYLELRLVPEALALHEHALGKFVALEMRTEQAWTLAQQGRAHAIAGDIARAEDALIRASALFVDEGNVVGAAVVMLARGELALARGESADALRFASDAARAFAQAGLADATARADVLRAYALLRSGDVAQAGEVFAATLGRARALQLLSIETRCLTGQGIVARESNDTQAAHAAFVAAIDLFERQREALPSDDLRSAFLADNLLPFRELLRIALDAHARSDTVEQASAVVSRLERFRARSLGERLVQSSPTIADPASQALRGRLNWLYRRVRRAQDEGEPTRAAVEQAQHIERELLERARRQRLVSDPQRSQASADGGFDPRELRSWLGPHDALIEYGVLDDELFACVVGLSGVHIERRVARWPDVLDAVRSARFQLEALRHGAGHVGAHVETLVRRTGARMQELHELVWAPLARALSGCTRAIVVPHGPLGAVPFAALHDGERYLCETFELAMAPSARTALHELSRETVAPARALVIGESSRLPGAEREARFVASLFAHSDVFVAEQATVEALRGYAGSADVVHLACHAQFRADNPMFSALHLHDGALTAESVEQLELRNGVVVLSACETALSEAGHGDEMIGLLRAFLIAGASRVIASLWPVDDEATSQLMADFYRALRERPSAAAALRSAQSKAIHRHPHPFYWAGFTVHGGW